MIWGVNGRLVFKRYMSMYYVIDKVHVGIKIPGWRWLGSPALKKMRTPYILA